MRYHPIFSSRILYNLRALFLVVFLIAFAVHIFLWQSITLIDEPLWLTRLGHLVTDLREGFQNSSPQRYASHPGMAVLTVGFFLHILGLSIPLAFKTALSLLVAGSVAGVAVGCRIARPHTAWWLPASAIVLLHPLYFHATPTTAVMGPVTACLFILALLLYEQHSTLPSLFWTVFSVCLGVGLATRLLTTFLIGTVLLILLAQRLRARQVVSASLLSIVVMIILNPLLWYFPIQHGMFVVFKLDEWVRNPLVHIVGLNDFVFLAPGTLLSLFLGILIFLARRTTSFPLPLRYFGASMLFTILLTTAIVRLPTQSLRYYFPIIFLWEMFLPLWTLHLADRIHIQRWHTMQVSTAFALLMTFAQAALFMYVWLLPERIHVI